MAGRPYLHEEDEAEQDADLVWGGQVGAEQNMRQRHDDERREELTQIEGCGEQGHDETDADAQQCPHHEEHVDVVHKEASCPSRHIEQQPRGGDGTRSQPSADGEKEEVCHDNQQRGHADYELHQQTAGLAEMSLDDAQRGGDGGSGHHGEQRHRQDGSCRASVHRTICRHSFRDVNLFHKICGVFSSTKL